MKVANILQVSGGNALEYQWPVINWLACSPDIKEVLYQDLFCWHLIPGLCEVGMDWEVVLGDMILLLEECNTYGASLIC